MRILVAVDTMSESNERDRSALGEFAGWVVEEDDGACSEGIWEEGERVLDCSIRATTEETVSSSD